MNDLHYLVILVWLFYLSECCLWLRRSGLVIQAGPNNLRLLHPSPSLGNRDKGLIWLDPLRPSQLSFVCFQWPISLSSRGLCSFVGQIINPGVRPNEDARYLSWSQVREITRHQATLYINGQFFADVTDPFRAARMAELIWRLAHTSESQREGLIREAVRATFNVAAIRRTVDSVLKAGTRLKATSFLMFLLLLVVLPVLVLLHQFLTFLVPFLLMLAAIILESARAFVRTHGDLARYAVSYRWRITCSFILTPTASIRARDLLGRQMLQQFDPLAIALALGSPGHNAEFLGGVLRDLTWPMQPSCPLEDGMAQDVEAAFRRTLRDIVTEVLGNAGYDIDKMFGAARTSGCNESFILSSLPPGVRHRARNVR